MAVRGCSLSLTSRLLRTAPPIAQCFHRKEDFHHKPPLNFLRTLVSALASAIHHTHAAFCWSNASVDGTAEWSQSSLRVAFSLAHAHIHSVQHAICLSYWGNRSLVALLIVTTHILNCVYSTPDACYLEDNLMFRK